MFRCRTSYGFTLLELLVVIAIIGILVTVGWLNFRPPEARLFASGVQAQIQQARFEAIKRNRPVAVVWEGTKNAFVTQADLSQITLASTLFNMTLPCTGTGLAVLKQNSTSEYRQVSLASTFPGVVWLPNGFIRKCDNTAIAGSTSAAVKDSRSTIYVKVNPGGSVELSNAP